MHPEEQPLPADGAHQRVQRRLVRGDGSVFRAEIAVVPPEDGRSGPTLVIEDISTRRAAEDALRLSEERLRIVFDYAPVGIRIYGLDGKAISANAAFQALVGYSEEELRALHFREITHPDDLPGNLPQWDDLAAGRIDEYALEKRYVRKDGAIVWSTMRTALVRDRRGRPWFTVAIDDDITERRALREQLAQTQKLEAIGRLAGGVAHDFNNLLTAIMGCAHLLLRDLPPGSLEHDEAVQIVGAAERAAELTGQLLAFGRQQRRRPRTLDLNAEVRRTMQLLRRLLGPDVELELELAHALDPVRADPAQVEQVVMNLVLNARDAMPRGGRLRVATAPAAEPGFVELLVADDGMGMDTATRERIFEPFFTTKEQAGTGLGLATVYGIVEQSGGSIEAASVPGSGSTFRVLWPSAPEEEPGEEPPAAATGAAAGAAHPAGGAASAAALAAAAPAAPTVLLVDDEEPVRRLAARILDECGFTVLQAPAAAEALELAGRHTGAIDVLVTDVRMPGGNGVELAQQLAARCPGLQVLLITGFAESLQDGPGPGFELLEKPFTPGELEARVRALLPAR